LNEVVVSVDTEAVAAVVLIFSEGAGKPFPESIAAVAEPVIVGAVQFVPGKGR
jgi:hypothetical protein